MGKSTGGIERLHFDPENNKVWKVPARQVTAATTFRAFSIIYAYALTDTRSIALDPVLALVETTLVKSTGCL